MKQSLTHLLLLTALLLVWGPLPAVAQPGNEALLTGIYTGDQALRGQQQYLASCSSCHAADLRGNSNAPALTGLSFTFIWEGRSLGELYTSMREQMPTDRPGSLAPRVYADILAYLLSHNGYPEGSIELPADPLLLDSITILAPPQQEGVNPASH